MDSIFDLQGRIALVVGACGNIGHSLCKGLAKHGADILISDLHHNDCLALANTLTSNYRGKYIPAPGDCTTEEGVRSIIEVIDSSRSIQIVLHCIGLISSTPIPGYNGPLESQTLEAWEKALKTNLTSAFLLAKHIHTRLDQSGNSSVIFLSSIYGSLGPNWSLYENTSMGNPLAYGASKGGLQQLMRYLATLWAPAVRVNCVSPGGIERGQTGEFIRRYAHHTPMQRMATPEDIVGPVIFLASDASRYVTGQNILVDGGWSAW